ncbi:MAG: NAD(P)/FAD-dependent oxidoreductase [Candidatus Hydrogenedentales bacterium]|jgi:protoporphyrinogen oxidase
MQSRIGIIGAGISGLAAALALAKRGIHVEVFERGNKTGGLISTFDFDGPRIERYYHFLCREDHGYFDLCRELGLEDRLHWRRPKTGFHYEGTTYPFTSPIDLLRFSPIPFAQRVRFGAFALEARLRQEWKQLDELAAKPWLIDRLGTRAFEVIWRPLLELKFGDDYDRISAAWVWHRLHRVARSKGSMGFLEGGSAVLLDALIRRLRELGVPLHLGKQAKCVRVESGRVQGIDFSNGETFAGDHVISTIPLDLTASLLPPEYDSYAAQLRNIRYIGVVCVVLKLKRRLTPYFWLNVHAPSIPFNGIIEYTNLNPNQGQGEHIVYVPYYVATDKPLYTAEDESVFRQSWDAVKQLGSGICDSDLLGHRVFRASHAQAVCPVGFLKSLPNSQTPIAGLRLLDSTYLYPEDRSQSGLILNAHACVEAIAREAGVP